ncbi:unnamed protein product [Acanthoscelides obtectus]|nr:unnamed protein product [Acanthoscelides obtectus]CAK1629731.1 hypothetical protein AOBTE_LOCUS5918 [Acanthoscelides obtectus]
MIQGQNSTETIYLSPSDALSNVHIAIKNNKRHVVFSKNRDVKHGRVRVKKNVNLTDLSQEYRRSSVNVVDLLDTTKSPISDINGKIFDYGGRTIPKPKKDILIDEEELDYKNIKYRKVRGIWLDGQCKCDLLYRSNKNKIGVKQYVLLLVIGIIIIS